MPLSPTCCSACPDEDATDKDQELPLRAPGIVNVSGLPVGEGGTDQDTATHHDVPLDLGGSLQWQMPAGVGSDMHEAGLLFNWDQSLDLIAGGLGMDLSLSY